MAKGKPKPADGEDKPLPPIRVRGQLHAPVRRACTRLATDPTEFVNAAVREKLEGLGLWPPADEKAAS